MAGRYDAPRMNVRVEGRGPDAIWYLRCNDCASSGQTTCWWPIGEEHWNTEAGLQRCRACHAVRRRRQGNPSAEELRARARRYYLKHRDHRRAYARRHYREHADEINAKRRERRQREQRDRDIAA